MDSIFHSTDKSVEYVHINSALTNGSKRKLSRAPTAICKTNNTTNLSQNLDKDKIFIHAKGRFMCFGSYYFHI